MAKDTGWFKTLDTTAHAWCILVLKSGVLVFLRDINTFAK
jgi:hypothetical protein